MRISCTSRIAIATLLLLPAVALAQSAQAPKFEAKLYAAHASIQPGGQTELAIEVTVEKDWHGYHPITIDTGSPTMVSFEAPPGVSFGPLHFPEPRLLEDYEMLYLSLDGKFVILTTLSLAQDVEPGPLPIKATVDALICKESCVPLKATAETTLKVAPDEPAAANAKLFEEARAAIPVPLDKAEYLEGSSVTVSKKGLGIGEDAELVVTLNVKKGFHIQDRDPIDKNLIPTQVFIERINGVTLGDQNWPEPHITTVPGAGKVREQKGEVKIRVPIKIEDALFASGPVEMRVLVTYQCCADAGECFAPMAAKAIARFEAVTPNPQLADPADRGTLYAKVTVIKAPAQWDWGTLLLNILFGFLGGMILNITPCVFPVISIKILGFVKQAGEDRGRIFRLGLVFCAGIMVWFWIFGIVTALGQVPLQHPPVTIGLAAVLFVLALSLFGVYEIILPGGAADGIGVAAQREGYPGAFMNGFLATLLGTACTGPLFAGAVAYAATQPGGIAFLIFTAAGLGMSTPYVVLCAFPAWLQSMPKPGPWMVTFKQAMGFVIVATVIFLLYVIGRQLDVRGLVWVIAFLGFLSLSAWLIGQIQFNWSSAQRWVMWVVAIAVGAFGLWFSLFYMYDLRKVYAEPAAEEAVLDPAYVQSVIDRVRQAEWEGELPWQDYRPGLAAELARQGYTAYVDYTADWCVNCKTNLHTSIEIQSTREKMRDLGVIPIVADYTSPNPSIRKDLLHFGFSGVPMNLIYPAGRPDDVIVLPVLFLPGIVHDALDKAGPSERGSWVQTATTAPLGESQPADAPGDAPVEP